MLKTGRTLRDRTPAKGLRLPSVTIAADDGGDVRAVPADLQTLVTLREKYLTGCSPAGPRRVRQ
jgi:hypothetical protein